MKIGNRLTLQYSLLVGLILLAVLIAVYILVFINTQGVFYERLEERALITANLVLEKDELTRERILAFEKKFAQTLPKEVVQVYDAERKIIYTSDKAAPRLSKDRIDAIDSEEELEFIQGDAQYCGVNYSDNQGNFIIVASAEDLYGREKVRFHLLVSIISYLLSLLVIFITGRQLSRRALDPINNVVNQVKEITASNLDLKVAGGKNKDEIQDLANTFNEMLQRLKKSFEIERAFVSNASHELRTPLTSIIGELQVLLSKPRSPEEFTETASLILSQSVQMKELLNSLLLLSQVEERNPENFRNEIRIDELLIDIQRTINSRFGKPLVTISLDALPEDPRLLSIRGNTVLLQSAISNIIENGIKFSSESPVECRLKFSASQIDLLVSDHGIGIQPEDINRLFHPFFRADNARSFKGHGIGLLLSQKIIRQHKGEITIQSTPGKGSVFTLSFNRT